MELIINFVRRWFYVLYVHGVFPLFDIDAKNGLKVTGNF